MGNSWMPEKNTPEAIRLNREYFEVGCLCIRDKKIVKQPENVTDLNAVKFYENNCKCSRNY
jgi:hypothetical protein